MKTFIATMTGIALLGGGAWYKYHQGISPMVVNHFLPTPRPDMQTVVDTSLRAIHAQNKITPMTARYVAVVTSRESSYGVFQSQKTLILPATARYDIDMHALKDVKWDAPSHTLLVHLPPVEVSGMEIDLRDIQEYSSGVLTSFQSVNHDLDTQNRSEAQKQLLAQAHSPQQIAMAQSSAIRAVAESFSMPLRTAGLDAKVVVTF